jgi:hypothetical protein
MRQPTIAEVRLDEGNAASSGSARPTRPPFWLLSRRLRAILLPRGAQGREDQVRQTGNPGNVG